MPSALLSHLLSFDNKFNKTFGANFPLYKFHRLYEFPAQLSDAERESNFFVKNEDKKGVYVLNPFFVALLRDHSIWFSPASRFNDPWDAGAAVSILQSDSAIQEQVLRLLFGDEEFGKVAALAGNERYPAMEDKLRDVFSHLRFACFSKHCGSNPMWAHYADNHRGVCLEFQFMKELPRGSAAHYAIDGNFTGHYPVRYSTDFTQLPNINEIGAAIAVLYTKHPDWAYEQEVRFVRLGDRDYPEVGGTVSFNKTSLTKVILGCKVPPPLWGAVEVVLDHYKYDHTALVRAEFDHRTQKLKYLVKNRAKDARANE